MVTYPVMPTPLKLIHYSNFVIDKKHGKHSLIGVMIILFNIFVCSGNKQDTSEISNRRYTETFTHVNDCFLEQIFNTSRIGCAVMASTLNAFAFAYDGNAYVCLTCLPPCRAGTMARSSLPVGIPLYWRGKDSFRYMMRLSWQAQ